jgi:hypothetical protein
VQLFVRPYANCSNVSGARTLAQRLELALSRFAPRQHTLPKPYWKVKAQFEFTYLLSPPTEIVFHEVTSSTSSGWHHSAPSGGELSSVWNRTGDCLFLVPEVSWAELQLFEAEA